MTINEPRMASGEEAAKATWDRAVADLNYSRLDRLDGLGSPVVRMGETPRLQILVDAPPPISAAEIARIAQAKATQTMRHGQQPRLSVGGAVILVVGLLGTLGLLVASMVGAA